MSTDREVPYPAFDLGLETAYRAYCGKDCNIRLTDEMIKEVVEVYCSLGPDPRSREVKQLALLKRSVESLKPQKKIGSEISGIA